MKIRNAKVKDAKSISSLVNNYAEQDKMLFRSMAEIYENLFSFVVAESDGAVLGCCCLEIVWADLAEIKSLAVSPEHIGQGIGRALVQAALKKADQIGVQKVFVLSLEPDFFKKMAFTDISKKLLPMKVWKDCAKCPKQNNCDELALIKTLEG